MGCRIEKKEQRIKKVRFVMSLSPNDIRNYEFPNQMRGYDKEEVDSFLDQIANELENLKQESLRLSMESDSLKSQLDSLKQFEDSIKGAAIDARKNADSTMSSAKIEAEKILSAAKTKAEELVSSKEAMISDYKKQLNRLETTKTSFANEIKEMIHVHLRMIEKIAESEYSYNSDTKSKDSLNAGDSIEVTNSSEVERNKMTSVGTKPSSEPMVTEEANAAEEIIQVAEKTPVDPELADALAEYEHSNVTSEKVSPETMIGAKVIPKQGEVVETTKRAEDIPDGFIAGNAVEESDESEADTGKVNLAPDAQEESCEHNAISVDDVAVSPENIVEELDNVVAKFEEEMDKAESN